MAIITEDYVSFEIAKLLKEKGFDILCHGYYRKDNPNDIVEKACGANWNDEAYFTSRPTLQMAMKWLREKYNIIISINPQRDKYYFTPWQLWDSEWVHTKAILPIYDKYEEAAEGAIKYCLEKLI